MNIELSDITRRFGRNVAVDGVTLDVGPGVLGLLGPNGAGKTSLLRMLATILPPSSGELTLLDRDPTRPADRREIRRRLGYLPQHLGYYPSFTVVEFVEYFALLKEVPPHLVPKAVAAAVEKVDLGPKAKAKLRTLSGGMLRRVGIAQAIVNEPQLLLFDEPTAGLDPEQRVAFRALIRDLGQTATVVVSTHLVEDVGAACSEVALMSNGKVVFRGTPEELIARGEAGQGVGDAPLERGYSAILGCGQEHVMTAVALSRSRPVPVLRIEIRRSVVLWAVPLLLALFYFDSLRTAGGFPPVWTVRSSVITSHMIADFGPFAAGLAAWVASREGRRKTGDLVATTVRPAWARQASALGATLFWLLLAFLAGVAAIYIDTALSATWGAPPLWPVAVGVVEVVTFAVIGFTAGALFPGRFTAPLAAIGTFLLAEIGFHAAEGVRPGTSTQGLLSSATTVPLGDAGVFYHVAPDIAIAQVMFMGGVTVALLGLLTLAPVVRVSYRGLLSAVSSVGRWLFVAGVALLVAGVAAAATAYSLAGTAKMGVSGWEIPALHDAASDQPIPYTPDCAGTSFKVCVHPAFSGFLASANTALQPVATEIAGLPGAPVRAEQVPSGDGILGSQGMNFAGVPKPGLSGTPAVYRYIGDDGLAPLWGSPAGVDNAGWRAGFQQEFLTAFIAGPPQAGPGPGPDAAVLPPNAAQQAVITALMTAVGSQPPGWGENTTNGQPTAGATPTQIAAAAQRFASLSSSARHHWLAAHLPALRAGSITLAQLP